MWLIVFELLIDIGNGIYAAHAIDPSPLFSLLATWGLIAGLCWWLETDNKKYQMPFVYDWQFLLSFGAIIFLPYYLFKTRGIKGGLTIMGILGLLLSTYLIRVLVYYLMTSAQG